LIFIMLYCMLLLNKTIYILKEEINLCLERRYSFQEKDFGVIMLQPIPDKIQRERGLPFLGS
jgi:hypothetical protein